MFQRCNLFISFSVVASLFLNGCTQNFQSAIDNIKTVRSLNKGPTSDYISALPYASSLVTINQDTILMILAAISTNPENNATQLIWMAKNKSTITTENGRIVHTTGFIDNDLDNLQSLGTLPFPNTKQEWQAIYDWSPGYRYNFSAQVTSQSLGLDKLKTELWTQTAEHVQEMVRFPSLNGQFNNDFWIAPETQDHKAFVVKSIQYIGPSMDRVEMVMIKPYLEFKQTPAQKQDAEKDSL